MLFFLTLQLIANNTKSCVKKKVEEGKIVMVTGYLFSYLCTDIIKCQARLAQIRVRDEDQDPTPPIITLHSPNFVLFLFLFFGDC